MVCYKKPVVELSRVETFSACHCLRVGELTLEENTKLFGKCARRHGHNYVLEVTVRGPLDAQTGMVLDMRLLKDTIEEHVLQRLDHSSIDEELEEFSGSAASETTGRAPATTENLAVAIWERLRPHLGVYLYRVRLWETDKNAVTFYGDYESDAHSGCVGQEHGLNSPVVNRATH
ncbi:hypothetical protein F1559_004276 [Cyanidiococcus yangmingshanensis]|uniref:6-pyruvoyltetrahydropterin synthase n=1 Tax=Cyanidiococcus yangmingshanensis TaxID=2690220 RepID=A0A7J7IJZ2_9RHOD|nr:hypothetical protein F1559_004276 [Cyanidiococcus yangmingshanensis]